MAVQRLPIKDFLELSENRFRIDVRSPAEFGHAHMPGAYSLPLFTNDERKIVGTTYKQKSREDAIKIGLDMFGPKMRKMVEEVEAQVLAKYENGKGGKDVYVYCWRGGMRSAAVAWLLDLYGFTVYTLAGGYKAFRNYVLQTFEIPFAFRILGGYTGSGKTEVLNQMEKEGAATVDLEQLACHKGSAFGSFKMPPQPTQEMFENLLALELRKKYETGNGRLTDQAIWLEDESQRIGNLNLPTPLWNTMRTAPLYFLEIPFEERLNHINDEYGACDREKLIEAVQRIRQRLGGLEAGNAISFLEEGRLRDAFSILLQYYDKRYLKGLHNREALSALLTLMPCASVTPVNAQLLTKHQPA